jgi:hypothetical protein
VEGHYTQYKMKINKFMIIGLIVILVVGIVSVFATGDYGKSWYGHKGWKGMGKHSSHHGDKSGWLEKMGLPGDASHEEIIEAKKNLQWGGHGDHMNIMRQKLGLPEDASDEEVKEAWQEIKGAERNEKKSFCHSS